MGFAGMGAFYGDGLVGIRAPNGSSGIVGFMGKVGCKAGFSSCMLGPEGMPKSKIPY